MAIRLAREEGLFAGTSTGANVVAAMRLAEDLGSGATIVSVMCDTGMKYRRRMVRCWPPTRPQLALDEPGPSDWRIERADHGVEARITAVAP